MILDSRFCIMLPKGAKKVFAGQIFDVYQWKQKMFDGTFETFEKVKRADTVSVFPIHKGKIVICRQRQPHKKHFYYSLIGGRIDSGEKPLPAAKRELLEETGMKAKKIVLWQDYTASHKVVWTNYFYVAYDCEVVAKQDLDAGEKITLLYVSFEEFIEMIERGVFDFSYFENEIFKMHKKGELGEFKKLLLG